MQATVASKWFMDTRIDTALKRRTSKPRARTEPQIKTINQRPLPSRASRWEYDRFASSRLLSSWSH